MICRTAAEQQPPWELTEQEERAALESGTSIEQALNSTSESTRAFELALRQAGLDER